jgi:L-threonylcarbamoyladenylate synthase
VSGALAAHYAPRTPLRLVDASLLVAKARELAGEGGRVAVLAHSLANPQDARLIWHAAPAQPAGYAHEPYASLRALDVLGVDLILVEALPQHADWTAIADRLGRAAVGSGAENDET